MAMKDGHKGYHLHKPVAMMARFLWLLLGLLSTGLAVAGMILPLVPATPFLLIAAYAFARSSPRLHNWLMDHAHFGPLIADWQSHGAISRPSKRVAVLAMLLTLAISWIVGVPMWASAVQFTALACAAAFILTRPDAVRR